MIKLSKSCKYRKDVDGVRIFDAKSLGIFVIDIKYYEFMTNLEKGISEKNIENKDLVDDLKKLNLIEFS